LQSAWRVFFHPKNVEQEMSHEKNLESIRFNVPDGLKHDLQDLAAQEDRALGELIRRICETHMYGAVRTLCKTESKSTEGGR
jgi:hypothetical protein